MNEYKKVNQTDVVYISCFATTGTTGKAYLKGVVSRYPVERPREVQIPTPKYQGILWRGHEDTGTHQNNTGGETTGRETTRGADT